MGILEKRVGWGLGLINLFLPSQPNPESNPSLNPRHESDQGAQSAQDNRGEPTEKLPSLAPVPDAACLPFPSQLECRKLYILVS